MDDNLQDVLSELAKGLGTSTGELWGWMRGSGIESYSRMQIARLWVGVGEGLVVMLACVAVAILLYRLWKKDSADIIDLLLCELFPSLPFIISAFFVMDALMELAGWMASPEGMVIEKFLEMVK